ncbi:MAG: hypothetical protein JW955_21900 [Sedimentisphaerales bacterium]|nr:hypothetical protein [Sedimentisphaerales bacterium]
MSRLQSSLVLLLTVPAAIAVCAEQSTRIEPLFADLQFHRGFLLSYPDSSKGRAVESVLHFGDANNVPVWRLCQWGTRHSLASARCLRGADGALSYENAAKRVTVCGSDSSNKGLTLEIRGSTEYGTRGRKYGESWPHLLIEQDAIRLFALDDVDAIRLRIRLRLLYSRNEMPANEYDPALHAAQFEMFFIVKNVRPESVDQGNYYWFGVPFYDNRHDIPPAYMAADAGKADATGKFIYTIAGQTLGQPSLKTGHWVTLDKDLLPHILTGLQEAVKRGYLQNSNPHDYAVANMNLGWEILGTFDAAIQVQELSIYATVKTSHSGAAQ